MPRIARLTAAGLVYHVTHHGNRSDPVFFEGEDREDYLRALAEAGRRHGFEVWAYCLMTNHVHLLGRGLAAGSLGETLREVQGEHARRINRRHQWSGHLWANRFYSSPMAPDHQWAAVRYIERNPVRVGIVERAEEYPWSSARAHCGLAGHGILSPGRPFPGTLGNWKSWLEVEDARIEENLRAAVRVGRPTGDEEYRLRLAVELSRPCSARPRGRPRE